MPSANATLISFAVARRHDIDILKASPLLPRRLTNEGAHMVAKEPSRSLLFHGFLMGEFELLN